MVADVDGNVIVVLSVPDKVRLLLKVRVLAAEPVSVHVPVVSVLPLIVVAVAAPSAGVVRVGDVDSTIDPVPVTEFESVTPP